MRFWPVLFLTASLQAASVPFNDLEVDSFSFEKGTMHLKGSIVWEHPLGRLKADSAEARFEEGAFEFPREIILNKDVDIQMNEGSEVKARFACFDCIQGIGVFHGTREDRVQYAKKNDKLTIDCERLELRMSPLLGKGKILMQQIHGETSVDIDIENKLHLAGDRAILSAFTPKGKFLRAELQCGTTPCQLTTPEKDFVEASSIVWNVENQQALLTSPQGTLQRESLPIFFSASEMIVDQAQNQLTMLPPVKIYASGHLETNGRVCVQRNEEGLQNVKCEGTSTLSFSDQEGNQHELTTFGTIFVDHLSHTTTLESPKDDEGRVLKDQQIHFEDPFGEMFADKAVFFYKIENKKFVPLSLVLEGNLKIQNRSSGAMQYALSDYGMFDFAFNTLTLKAINRPRVLFYDEFNKLQASAPSLVLKRDPVTMKNVIEGTGNVRFMFAEEEFNELKKRFLINEKQ